MGDHIRLRRQAIGRWCRRYFPVGRWPGFGRNSERHSIAARNIVRRIVAIRPRLDRRQLRAVKARRMSVEQGRFRPGRTFMPAISISPTRRDFLDASAAAGAAGLFADKARAATVAEAIRPFEVNFLDETLADLKRRIAATKWPERETVQDATQGVRPATTREVARYGGRTMIGGRSKPSLRPGSSRRSFATNSARRFVRCGSRHEIGEMAIARREALNRPMSRTCRRPRSPSRPLRASLASSAMGRA